jgi:hypothetical protein
MLSGPGALLFPRYLRHRSYVILPNVSVVEAFILPHFSKTKPSRSCHGYYRTPHTHFESWLGWW